MGEASVTSTKRRQTSERVEKFIVDEERLGVGGPSGSIRKSSSLGSFVMPQ